MVWTSKRVCFIVLSNNLYSERYNNAIIYVYETMSVTPLVQPLTATGAVS